MYKFAYGLGDQSLIPGRVIPKTQKMVLDTSALLGTYQGWRATIQGRELHPPLSVVAIKKGAFGLPSATITNFTFTKI